MTPPQAPPGRTWLGAALVLVLLMGTIVSFGVGFGVLTDCTNSYSCTRTDCDPCVATGTWLNVGWAGQGVLLLAGLTVAVLARRRPRPRTTRTAALAVAGLSVALVVVTTTLAELSF